MTRYFDLEDRNIVVTGANGHLGKAIVAGLLESGAQVFAGTKKTL